MITQKPISFKIDTYTLQQLDEEVRLGYMNRNKAINEAVRMWLDAADTARRRRCTPDAAKQSVWLAEFIQRWFPRFVNRSV